MAKPTICFVAPHIYYLLTNRDAAKAISGTELQLFLLGRELSRRQYDVSFISFSYDPQELDHRVPFKTIPTIRPPNAISGPTFRIRLVLGVWRALAHARGEILCVRGASFMIAPVVAFAIITGKKVLFSGASDSDFDRQNIRLTGRWAKKMFFWAMPRSNAIVVQNSKQKKLLSHYFRKEGRIIHNCFPRSSQLPLSGDAILWVSSIRPVKRPMMFLELAYRIPDQQFTMVGGVGHHKRDRDNLFYHDLLTKGRSIPNLRMTGFLPFEETEKHFSTARLVVNTSSVEGFPTPFLQAWSRGVPVVSFVDPDDLIKRNDLGIVANDLDDMTHKIKDICKRKITFSPHKIQQFFNEHFTVEKIVDEYETLFTTLAEGSPAQRAN